MKTLLSSFDLNKLWVELALPLGSAVRQRYVAGTGTVGRLAGTTRQAGRSVFHTVVLQYGTSTSTYFGPKRSGLFSFPETERIR
jgi:hypothetical protein